MDLSVISNYVQQTQSVARDIEHIQTLRKFYGGMRQDKCKVLMSDDDANLTAEVLLMLDKTPDDIKFVRYKGRISGGIRGQVYFPVHPTPKQLAKAMYYHVMGDLNLCLFFDLHKNNLICFNIDGNRDYFDRIGDPTDEVNDVVTVYTQRVKMFLGNLGVDSIVTRTGNGYHIWIRFAEAIDNAELRDFATRVSEVVERVLLRELLIEYGNTDKLYLLGHKQRAIQTVIHPLPSITQQHHSGYSIERNSIRLFGTKHCNTGEFTRIYELDGILSEQQSWERFKHYQPVTMEQFRIATEGAKEWEQKLEKELQ